MNAQVSSSIRQINLFNLAMLPTQEVFSANRIVVGVVSSVLVMAAIGWWAFTERQRLSHELTSKAAARAEEIAKAERIAAAVGNPLTPKELAALENTLRSQGEALAARRDVRDLLRRGLATDTQGPSALMRLLATSAPTQAWLTDIRVAGPHIEVVGRTLEPTAVNMWLERLTKSNHLSAKVAPTLKLERVEVPSAAPGRMLPVYVFTIVGALAAPFADDGGRP